LSEVIVLVSMQVGCSSHVSVRGDSHLAQDFWSMAERSFSLFGCTGGPTLQVAYRRSSAFCWRWSVLQRHRLTGCVRSYTAQLSGWSSGTHVSLQPTCAVLYAPVAERTTLFYTICSEILFFLDISVLVTFSCVDLSVHGEAILPLIMPDSCQFLDSTSK